jgi:hypothetical protein
VLAHLAAALGRRYPNQTLTIIDTGTNFEPGTALDQPVGGLPVLTAS